jgi:hypothetical protein
VNQATISLLLVVLATVAACSSGGKSATKPPGGGQLGAATTGHQNPCALVTKVEAESILGTKIDPPQERPLGPTCVYQAPGSAEPVTVTLQQVSFNQIRPQIQSVTEITGLGHSTYCGTFGRPQLFVVLTDTSLLNVVAPCDIARKFAAKAVPRLRTP